MKLVYITSGKSSVFDSQVLALLKYYKENNSFEEVILLFGYRSQGDIDWLEKKDTIGVRIYYYKTFPNYPFFNILVRKSLSNTLKNISQNFSDYFFHIRGEMVSYHFKSIMSDLKLKPNQLMTDVRGVSLEELQEFSGLNPILKKLKIWNTQLALNALLNDSCISVVSTSLKEYLIEKLDINPENIVINQCLVNNSFSFNENNRFIIRTELGIREEEPLLVFASGGTASWQNNEQIIKIADKGIKVLNLSKVEIFHNKITNRFVPYNEMSSYLSAADIAFIWRDKSIVNKVASPVKFSEYLACGLPIVHNGNVDLINEIIVSGKEGLSITNIDEIDLINLSTLIQNTDRDILSKKGRCIFSIEKTANSYYKTINNI